MTEQIKSPEAATNGANESKSATKTQTHNKPTPVDTLLARLNRVRYIGLNKHGAHQWMASCSGPQHKNGDQHPSLAISQGDDGRILVFCNANCDPAEIMHGAGLEVSDMFPDKGLGHHVPIPKPERWNYRGLLKQLDHEALDILCAANAMQQRDLTADEFQRLEQATIRVARIAEAAR